MWVAFGLVLGRWERSLSPSVPARRSGASLEGLAADPVVATRHGHVARDLLGVAQDRQSAPYLAILDRVLIRSPLSVGEPAVNDPCQFQAVPGSTSAGSGSWIIIKGGVRASSALSHSASSA